MEYQIDFTKAYREMYEGVAAQGGVMDKGAKKPEPKAQGGDKKKDGEGGDEAAVRQAVYDIRYRAKREGVPVAQAMTDYLKHSGSLGPKARAELKKKLMGEGVEQIDEISAQLAHTASMKADEVARKARVAGDKETAAKKVKQASRLYKGVGPRRAKERMAKEEAEMQEVWKGKHGQSDKEYADSRSQGGKMVSGDSKQSGAEYTHGRRVKAANPGMQPDVGGKTKPKSQGKMDRGTRADLQYRKANLARKEEYTLGELKAILEDDSLAHLHADVFDLIESVLLGEEVVEEESQKKSQKGDTLYKVRVVNVDGRSETRWASRAKIAQLRGNDNITSVEITGHGEAYNKDAGGKSDKKLDPVGKEDGDVDNDGDKDSSDKYLMKRRKAIGKAMAKEEYELDEANRAEYEKVAKERAPKDDKKLAYQFKDNKDRRRDLKKLARLVRHADGMKKNPAMYDSFEAEGEMIDENRAAARSAGGYKDDSKKQPDPSKKGFTGIGNMSIDQIRKMSARIEKEKSAKK